MNLIKKFWNEEDGQDLIEYALLAGFVSLTVVTMLTNIGTGLNTLYSSVNNSVTDAGNGAS